MVFGHYYYDDVEPIVTLSTVPIRELSLCLYPPQDSPEHEVHELQTLSFEEAVSVGRQHQTRTERIKKVLHHLLLLRHGRVMPLEHLWRVTGVFSSHWILRAA